MQKELIIEGSRIHDIPSFYEEINRVFMAGEDWKIGPSLDAFNDLLHGGFGAISTGEAIQLVWKNIESSKAALGYEVTRKYYEEKLQPGSPFDKGHFRKKLEALILGRGETYFDMLMGIIAEHKNITLLST